MNFPRQFLLFCICFPVNSLSFSLHVNLCCINPTTHSNHHSFSHAAQHSTKQPIERLTRLIVPPKVLDGATNMNQSLTGRQQQEQRHNGQSQVEDVKGLLAA